MPPTDSTWLFLRDLAILSAHWEPLRGRVEYLAWSPRFRELEESEEVPFYTPSISSSRGVKMVEWREAPSALPQDHGESRARTKTKR